MRANRRTPTSREAWEVYGGCILAIGLFVAVPQIHGRWPQALAVIVDGLVWLALAALLRSNRGGVSEWYAESIIPTRNWRDRIPVLRLERGFALILAAWGALLVALGILLLTPLFH